MARREKDLGDSEEVRAAIADLQEKVEAKKAAQKAAESEQAEPDTEVYYEDEHGEAYDDGYEEDYDDGYEEDYDGEYGEAPYEDEIAVKNFEDRINDTVKIGELGDAIIAQEEMRRERRERARADRRQPKEKSRKEKEKAVQAKPVRKRRKKGKIDDDVIISMEGVSKSYIKGVPALNDVNIHIRRGDFVFIVGDSGSGKSTLIRLLLRELKPDNGTIMVNGFQVDHMRRGKVPKLRRSMGVVFQDFRLLKDRNVYENVAFAQRIIQAPLREMKRNVPNILALVGLAGKYKARPNELSGGEQQRVALARALVNQPPILLADEPTGNLDVKNTIEIMNLLDRINKNGTTVVVVTHNDKIVNDMKKRVITIKNGVIVSDEEAGGYIYEN